MPLLSKPAAPPAGELLDQLHRLQIRKGYIALEDLAELAQACSVPLSRLYHSASFYEAFSFEPRGRHMIRVCMGTACHIRGGEKLLEVLKARLHVDPGGTTADREFSLETVHCVGACSMSPVLRIDTETRGRVKANQIGRLLRSCGSRDDAPAEEEGGGQ